MEGWTDGQTQPGGAPKHQSPMVSQYKEGETPTHPSPSFCQGTQGGGQPLQGGSGGSPTARDGEHTGGPRAQCGAASAHPTPQQNPGLPLTRVLCQGRTLPGGGGELPCGPLALMEVAESCLYYLFV